MCPLVVAVACNESPGEEQAIELFGSAQGLRGLLDSCAGLADAPLPERCAALAESIGQCVMVHASCPAGDESCALADTVRCTDESELAALRLAPGEWLWRGPVPGGGRFEARGRNERDGVRIEGSLRGSAESPWLRWAPAAGGAEAGVLSGEGAIVHGRLRPRGGLVPRRSGPASVAERLYGLRTELFSQAILEGSVEAVVYPPVGSEQLPLEFPLVAIAVDFRLRSAAVVAIENYIRELREQWPVVRSAYSFAGFEGACLADLRVLPELAPCYVATERSLVVGWNRESLERALGSSSVHLDVGNTVLIDFEAMAAADRQLAALRTGRKPGLRYPFARATVSGRERSDGVAIEVRLEGAHQ